VIKQIMGDLKKANFNPNMVHTYYKLMKKKPKLWLCYFCHVGEWLKSAKNCSEFWL